ncbi:MAG: Malonyl CoA-acyl carrier protein transacylase [Firmicutes bacterium ADurb.Bin419]|nr:MAG: Malonyl CoA-acyl carrier protein transacylase [Firmicutes bacterium ADurb.Bin419]
MKKIAFLFPGQGSQYVGMGKKLYENYTMAAEVFDEANDVLGFDLKKLCFNGDMQELTKTENTQPAILTHSVAAFRVCMEKYGIEPMFLAGHSLGEISALTCSGAIAFRDAIRIVRSRGRFMQEAVPQGIGSMAAIGGLDKSVIEEECSKISNENQPVVVSNYNSLDQIVISGYASSVNAVSERLKKCGARVVPLKVSAPFHSPLMQPAAYRLKEELGQYSYNELKLDVLSNVTALPYRGKDAVIDNLTLQIVSPVRWYEIMKYLELKGIDMAIELGPQTVLRNLMKRNVKDMPVFSFDDEGDIPMLERRLSKKERMQGESTGKGLKLVKMCLATAVCTKNTNSDDKEYAKGVVEPYRKIQKMKEELEADGCEPSAEQLKDAVEMLKSVFKTKGTDMEEQHERFTTISKETGFQTLFEM